MTAIQFTDPKLEPKFVQTKKARKHSQAFVVRQDEDPAVTASKMKHKQISDENKMRRMRFVQRSIEVQLIE
jgi:hypothetical protein